MTFHKAAKDPRWLNAMKLEVESLEQNNTWDLVKVPKGKKPIASKWVYKVKYDSNGEVEHFKARLVTKRYNQRQGVDFTETFSPFAKMVTVRIILSLVAVNKWYVHQMDVSNVSLQGDLSKEVYMDVPSRGGCGL